MVYLSKKKIKGKYYAYLVKSIRLPNGDVKTISKRVETKNFDRKTAYKLAKRHNIFFLQKEIDLNAKWAMKSFKKSYIFPEGEIEKLESIRVSFKYLIKKLSGSQRKDVFDRFTVNFTYDSNAIEGNSLTLKDVSIVIFENEIVEGKSLREIFETRNSRRVMEGILKKNFKVSHADIIKMHRMLMRDIDERTGYKKIPNVIYRAEKEVETTPPEKVEKEMSILMDWHNKAIQNMHPLEVASIFHGRFEKIHPFEDGNGRVGRFLINVILVNNGYPPMIIRKTSRTAYMESLKAFDNGYQDKLKRFMLKKFKDTYRKFFEVYVKYI
jgi:Fic family protein